MKKYSDKNNKYQSKSQKETPLNFIYSLILLAYGYVTVFTPNLETLDSNGPKFLSIALLNLVVFAYLFTRKEFKLNPGSSLVFFKSAAGIFFALWMVVSVLSFFKAINVLESILHFCKIFTVFSAAYLVSVVVAKDKRYLEHLALGMIALLIFDSISVYYNIHKYIDGKIVDIALIKTIYSNKNILAASIFVKIPFALWLFTFYKGWKQKIGFAGSAAGLLAVFFMSSRAFYLGTFFLSIAYLAFLLTSYLQQKQKVIIRKVIGYVGVLLVTVLIFSTVQKVFYSNNAGLNAGIEGRLSTISTSDESAGKRLAAWKRSFNVIKQDPLLGCGLGNWKVVTLKDENKTNPNFIYQYKAHNDFIETTAEIGIFGGLFFAAIFISILFYFLKALLKKESDDKLSLLFLATFGLMAYFFDAFFNFPQDRPEIQALFALFAGAGVALTKIHSNEQNSGDSQGDNSSNGIHAKISGRYLQILERKGNVISKIWAVKLLVLLIFSAYILTLNFQSLRLQRIIKDEMNSGKLRQNSDRFIRDFPWIPDINVVGEPIAAQKARYLINEKKYDKTIEILKRDKSSPWDTRPEYFIATSYFNMGKLDSAFVYNKKVYDIKPNMFENISMMCGICERTGRIPEAISILDIYLKTNKTNSRAWMVETQFLNNSGDIKKANAYIDSAYRYLPADTAIIKQRNILKSSMLILPYTDLYNRALSSFQAKRYDESIQLLSEFISKEPNLPQMYECRAFSYYFTKQYQASINDIDKMFSFGIRSASLLNLKGVNLQILGKNDEACTFYKAAMQAGSKDGATNYNRICGGAEPQAQVQTNNPLLRKK
jgi:O-antigen ligase